MQAHINPLTAIDANTHVCVMRIDDDFLGNFPLETGSATAERVGFREVGGVT